MGLCGARQSTCNKVAAFGVGLQVEGAQQDGEGLANGAHGATVAYNDVEGALATSNGVREGKGDGASACEGHGAASASSDLCAIEARREGDNGARRNATLRPCCCQVGLDRVARSVALIRRSVAMCV